MQKFAGLYPGIAEEAFETIRANKALFVLGGFGGAAMEVFKAIYGNETSCKRLIQTSESNGALAKNEARFHHQQLTECEGVPTELKFNAQVMAEAFRKLGIKGLAQRNGLTVAENEQLANCQNLHEILELLVKGLTKIRSRIGNSKSQ